MCVCVCARKAFIMCMFAYVLFIHSENMIPEFFYVKYERKSII